MTGGEYYRSLPTKRMAAGALIRNESGQLLIVKPTYKEEWEIPGGSVEVNESPANACVREMQEELGVDLELHQLVCVDYTSGEGDRTESLQFLFLGPTLSFDDINRININHGEISEFRFVNPGEIGSYLVDGLCRRVSVCVPILDSAAFFYLEDGLSPFGDIGIDT